MKCGLSVHLYLAACVLLIPATCAGQDNIQTGRVVRVKDGDTLVFSTNIAGRVRELDVRLSDIDAPEIDQPFGQQAKQALANKVNGPVVVIRADGADRFGRILGTIKGSGMNSVNFELVEAGVAWHYKQYSNDNRFTVAENLAKQARRGLWAANNSVPPWVWRQIKAKAAEPQEQIFPLFGRQNDQGFRDDRELPRGPIIISQPFGRPNVQPGRVDNAPANRQNALGNIRTDRNAPRKTPDWWNRVRPRR